MFCPHPSGTQPPLLFSRVLLVQPMPFRPIVHVQHAKLLRHSLNVLFASILLSSRSHLLVILLSTSCYLIVHLLSTYCLLIVLILSSYSLPHCLIPGRISSCPFSSVIVQILSKYCPVIVQLLSSYCLVLDLRYCPNNVQLLFRSGQPYRADHSSLLLLSIICCLLYSSNSSYSCRWHVEFTLEVSVAQRQY